MGRRARGGDGWGQKDRQDIYIFTHCGLNERTHARTHACRHVCVHKSVRTCAHAHIHMFTESCNSIIMHLPRTKSEAEWFAGEIGIKHLAIGLETTYVAHGNLLPTAGRHTGK